MGNTPPLAAGLLAVGLGFSTAILGGSDAALADGGFLRPDQERPPILVHTQQQRSRSSGDAVALLARARAEGRIRVIVGMRMLMRAEENLAAAEVQLQRRQLLEMQSAVIQRTFGPAPKAGVVRYDFIPYVAMYVDAAQLQRLLVDPQVVNIAEDMLLKPLLAESKELTHADDVWTKPTSTGNDIGTGYVVAVLDSGVAHLTTATRQAHPMLAGKVVSEACYSTDSGAAMDSLCPRGVEATTARGSGVNCNIFPYCSHGTHVASIAVGKPAGGLSGIAHGARLISIQIYSRMNTAADCSPDPPPCIVNDLRDMLRAFNRVYDLRTSFRIAALNLSAGSPPYSSGNCTAHPAVTAALQRLRSARIAPVISAGNENRFGVVTFPACVSSAIAVGNSTKGDVNQLEHVHRGAGGSNHAEWVKLMAPGRLIRAAVPPEFPGPSYHTLTGTSQAAPHVAGAFALLRQAKPAASVNEILEALKCSGKTVEWPEGQTPANRIAKPRIDLLGAYNFLRSSPSVKTRSWTFDDSADALDFTPFFGEWSVEGGLFVPEIRPAPNAFATSVANCHRSLEITARMRWIYPRPATVNHGDHCGVLWFKTKLDYAKRAFSGYRSSFCTDFTQPTRGSSFGITRLDSCSLSGSCTSFANVCSPGQLSYSVNWNKFNTLKVVSNGATHRLYVNGQLVCSGTDNRYPSGPVMIGPMGLNRSTGEPVTGRSFALDTLTIKSLDVSSAVSAGAAVITPAALAGK